MQFKSNWAETRERFTAWWAHESTGRPLLQLWTDRARPLENPLPLVPYMNDAERYLDVEKSLAHQMERLCTEEPLAEGYPVFSLDLGSGSLALYLGSEPHFSADSLWFEPALYGYDDRGSVHFDPNNRWFRRHLDMFARGKEVAEGTDAVLGIPDMIEHVDILSALRGQTTFCYDLYDHPEQVRAALLKLNEHYKTCYDAFRAYCTDETGGSAFTIFSIWGHGRTAKIQCDASAMISPAQFRDFALEPLRAQCQWLDNSLFHLDGPECICHVPALMEIEELDAVQWTAGERHPPPGEECWYDLYRMIKDADKGLWIALFDYAPDVAVQKADRLVRKFGAKGFYFLMPKMDRQDADALLIKAEREWKC